MSQSFKLFRLQQIDSQIDRIQERLRDIETALSKDENLRRAEKHVAQSLTLLEAERKALHKAEEHVREQGIKIEQTEATLYGGKVRNPKELQDLQSESAALKRYREVLEDRQLKAMISLEEAETVYEAAVKELEKVRVQLDQDHRDLTQERARLLAENDRLESERRAAASTIEEADMRLYEQLRMQRRGIAVAKVTDKACSACGSTLSAALLHAARSPNQLSRCAMCGRILYGG